MNIARIRNAVLGAAGVEKADKPRANLHKTMMMGGDAIAPQPVISMGPPPESPPSGRPTTPLVEETPRSADASPLSRSVLAPSSWRPPASLQGTMPLNQMYQPPTTPGVDVGRVVPVGTPDPRPQTQVQFQQPPQQPPPQQAPPPAIPAEGRKPPALLSPNTESFFVISRPSQAGQATTRVAPDTYFSKSFPQPRQRYS
jgi:hypothetical protein